MGFNFFDVPSDTIKKAAGTGRGGIRLYPTGLYVLKIEVVEPRNNANTAWINTKISVHAMIEKDTKKMKQPEGSGFIFQSFFLIKKDGTKNEYQEKVYATFVAALSGYDTQGELVENFGPDPNAESIIDIITSMGQKVVPFAGTFCIGFVRENKKNKDKDGKLKPVNEVQSFNKMSEKQTDDFTDFITPSNMVPPSEINQSAEPSQRGHSDKENLDNPFLHESNPYTPPATSSLPDDEDLPF